MNDPASPSPAQPALYKWIWRWHGYAGLFVVPFIFFMALTGLPYVWEQEFEDALHPEYRALTPQARRASYEDQLNAARKAEPQRSVTTIAFDGDPRHATKFTFGTKDEYPVSVTVNPFTGEVISRISEWTRLSFAAISLHGLIFIEPYGSWLLELLACWGIVLCITGVYLWWPRGKGKWFGVFVPRWRSDGRTRWRDLHAVTGFYFAAVLSLYLVTGLPWTAFWGGRLMTQAQTWLHEDYPCHMTNASGLASTPPTPDAKPLPLDALVQFGLSQHLPGQLVIEPPASPQGTVHLYNRTLCTPTQRHFQLDTFTALPVGEATWDDMPVSQKVVALGIDMHQGRLLGRVNQIVSTLLSLAFMFIAAAGMIMWWKRRPRGRLDFSVPDPAPTWTLGLRVIVVVLGLLMPILGLSFVIFALRSRHSSAAP